MTRRIPGLDGIRGLAALFVIYQHCYERVPGRLPLGQVGVDAFFALSGFLIGGILLDVAGTPGWVVHFYQRRTFRIWPLYFLTLGVVAWTDLPGAHPTDWWMPWVFLGNFRLALGHDTRVAYGILWSLCVEEHAYILLPPLIRWVKRAWLPLALAGVCLSSIGLRIAAFYWGTPSTHYYVTPCRLDGIFYGVIAAWIYRERRDWIRVVSLAAGPLWLILWVSLFKGADVWTHFTSPLLAFVQPLASIATAALVLGLAANHWRRLGQVLSWRPLRYVGTISYGVYLLHPLVIEVTLKYLIVPPATLLVFATIGTLLLATFSWYAFERPLLRRFSTPSEAPAVVVPIPVPTP